MSQDCAALLQKIAKLEVENEELKIQMESLKAKSQDDLAPSNDHATSHAASKSASASAKKAVRFVIEVLTKSKTCTMSGQAQAEAVADMQAQPAPKDRRRHSEASVPLTRSRQMRDLFYRPPSSTQELKSPTSQMAFYKSWHSEPTLSALHSMRSESLVAECSLEEAKDSLLQSMRWEDFKAEMRERIKRRDSLSDKSSVEVQGRLSDKSSVEVLRKDLAPTLVCDESEREMRTSLIFCQDLGVLQSSSSAST